jgi:hypothetical protein
MGTGTVREFVTSTATAAAVEEQSTVISDVERHAARRSKYWNCGAAKQRMASDE